MSVATFPRRMPEHTSLGLHRGAPAHPFTQAGRQRRHHIEGTKQ